MRTRAGLKDRGLELLGMARPQPVPDAEALSQPLGEEARGTPAPIEATPHLPGESVRVPFPETEQDARSPWDIDEIEKLLGEEADMAVGEEKETAAETPPSSRVTSLLPAEEWIAPVPVTAVRPLPHPPPELLTPPGHGVSPSPPKEAGLPSPEHGRDRVTAPEIPLPAPTFPSPETSSTSRHPATLADRLTVLEQEIEAAYEHIRSEQQNIGQEVTDWCHQLLMEARAIITQGKIEELPRAEWYVEQVRARLDRAQKSVSEVYTPIALTLWGIGWFFVVIYLIFDPTWLLRWIGLDLETDFFINPTIFLRSLVFGGLGGVAAIFYHVFKYVRERNFDDKHTLSYLGKPFMGMILGAMAYLGMFVLMRILGMKPVGLQVSDAELLTHVFYMAVLYLFAMALGFKENRVFNLLNHAVKAMLGGELRRSQVEKT